MSANVVGVASPAAFENARLEVAIEDLAPVDPAPTRVDAAAFSAVQGMDSGELDGVGNAVAAPPAATGTPMTYEQLPGSAFNGLLKLSGPDLVLIDRSSQKELARQAAASTSKVMITTGDADDVLVVDLSTPFATPVWFNAGGQASAKGDRVEVIGQRLTTEVEAEVGDLEGKVVLKAGVFGSSTATPSITALDVEGVSAKQLNHLKVSTQGGADDLSVISPEGGWTQVSGSSDKTALVPVAVSEVENLTVDADDVSKPSWTKKLTRTIGLSSTPIDQVSIANGALVATGLKNFSVITGLGKDVVRVYGAGYSLPVPGGVFGYTGGSGNDRLVTDFGELTGSVDSAGNGVFQGTSGSITLLSVEKFSREVERPLVVIPDWAGSFAVDSAIGDWFRTTGLAPESLTLDPVNGLYIGLQKTLLPLGYKLGESLFVANWDWRLPLAPVDVTMDGKIEGITATTLTDRVFQYGVDYLGYTLKAAVEGWARAHGGEIPESVDVVAHGAGGLLARAYLQSDAYGAVMPGGGALPLIQEMVGVAVPNQGTVVPWMLLQNSGWNLTSELGPFAQFVDLAYARVLMGGTITTPFGDITLSDIRAGDPLTGTPDPKRFLARYLPSLRDLLPTTRFLNDVNGALGSINADPQLRNNFLLDLNDGQGLSYEAGGQVPAGRDPNRFLTEAGHAVAGHYTAIYSDAKSTVTAAQTRIGGGGSVKGFDAFGGRTVGDGETWYEVVKTDAFGDGVATTLSVVQQLPAGLINSGKVVVRHVVAGLGGTLGTGHGRLMSDLAGLEFIGRGLNPFFTLSDVSAGGAYGIKDWIRVLVKTHVQFVLQTSQDGRASGASIAKAAFARMMGSLGYQLGDLFQGTSEDPDAQVSDSDSDGRKDFTLEAFTVPMPIGDLPGLNTLVKVQGLELAFNSLQISKDDTAPGGYAFDASMTLSATVGSLLSTTKSLTIVAEDISGTFTFSNKGFESFSMSVGSMRFDLKRLIRFEAVNLAIQPFEDVVFSAGTIAASLPKLNLTGAVHGLQVTRDGEFSVSGFSVSFEDPDNPNGTGLLHTLKLGKFMPFDLTGVAVKFLGDTNNNGLRDVGETFDMTAFDLTVRGSVNTKFFSALPFTPIIRVGEQQSTKPGDEISFTVTVSEDGLAPKDIGPITLGFSDLKVGKITLGSTITLGGYRDGRFVPTFGGVVRIESGLEELKGSAQVVVSGSFDPDMGVLSIAGGLQVGFKLKNGLIAVQDAQLTFGMVITSQTASDGSFSISVAPPQGQSGYLGALSVGLLEVKLGNYMTFRARNTTLDFNAHGSEPLVRFGGEAPKNLDPNATFKPSSVPDGALSAVFGTAAGPLSGWGGVVGNFAIGADLSFQLLDKFFVELLVGSNPNFGLPKFLPVQLRSVKVQFNSGAIRNGELVDGSDFTLSVSGGVVEKPSWPIFGEFSGLKINVGKLVDGEVLGAIENLDGFTIGVRDVRLGPLKISGAFGLGLVRVDTNGDGILETAYYARLGGKFFYSGIGGGIDIVFSEYGPVLATISAGGLVIPKIGLVFGFRDAGFVFGGEPIPSVNSPEELLENPLIYSPTTITTAEIERRIEYAMIHAQPTWNRSFALTGTGTVTSIYAQGWVSGELTVAANIGFEGPNAGLKLLGVGSLDVFGMSMARAAVMWDFSNLLAPKMDFAFSLPSPDNPIGFLFPAKATLTATLDTKGVAEMPLVGVGVFLKRLSENALGTAQALFETVMARVAEQLDADHSQTLSTLLLDLDEDGVVSSLEGGRSITPEFLRQRAVGDAAAGIPGLLEVNFDRLLAMTPTEWERRVGRGSVFVDELLPLLIREAALAAPGSLNTALEGLGKVIQQAAVAGLRAGWNRFDPSLKITGRLQPVLFGMPIGEPVGKVDVFVDKRGISFGFTSPFGPISVLTSGLIQEKLQFEFRLDLPDELVELLITNLEQDAAGVVNTLPQFLLKNINPFKGWEVLFSGGASVQGFKLGTVSGIIFGPQPKDANQHYTPEGLFADYVVNLDPDGDGQPNADLAEQAANSTQLTIPVNSMQHYQDMLRFGGVALTGQLFMPELLRDPVETVQGIDWTLPEVSTDLHELPATVEAVNQYVQRIVAELSKQGEWAKLQAFIPSPAVLFEVGNYLDPASQGVVKLKDLSAANAELQQQVAALTAAAFLDGYSNLEVLGTDLGRTRIQGTATGLQATANIGWLAGLQAQLDVGRRTLKPEQLVYDLATSPVGRTVLAGLGISDPSTALAVLRNPAFQTLPQIDLAVAGFEASLSSERFYQWIAQRLGLPSSVVRAANSAASATAFVGVYTPGYGGADATEIQRAGGVVLDARLNIAGLVDDATFRFEIAPFSVGAGTDLSTLLIPEFHARASVPHLRLPGLAEGVDALRLDDAVLDLRKDAQGFALDVKGHLEIPGTSDLQVSGTLRLSDRGIAGSLDIQASGAGRMIWEGSGFRFDGRGSLRINTGSVEQANIPPSSARVSMSGALSLTMGGVERFAIRGAFGLAVNVDGIEMAMNGEVSVEGLGLFSVSGGLGMGRDGLWGALQLGGRTLTGPGYELSGAFQVEVNSTGVEHVVPGLEISRMTGEVLKDRAVTLAPTSLRLTVGGRLKVGEGFEVAGAFGIEGSGLRLRFFMDGRMTVFGVGLSVRGEAALFGSDGTGRGGVYANFLVGGIGPSQFSVGGLTLMGQARLLINSTSQVLDGFAPGTYQVVIEDANVGFLGFAASGTLRVGMAGGVFTISIPSNSPLTLDFLGLATLSLYGTIDSTGYYYLRADAHLGFSSSISIANILDEFRKTATFTASVDLDGSVTFGNGGFGANFSATGSVGAHVKYWWFGEPRFIDMSLGAKASGSLALWNGVFTAALSAKINAKGLDLIQSVVDSLPAIDFNIQLGKLAPTRIVPAVSVFSVPGVVDVGQPVTLTGAGWSPADPGRRLMVRWHTPYTITDWAVVDPHTPVSTTFTPAAPGRYDVGLELATWDPSIDNWRLAYQPGTVTVAAPLVSTPPIVTSANPGGPYFGTEGQPMLLNALGSLGPGGIVRYEWDLHYDGQTFRPERTEFTPFAFLPPGDDVPLHTIALRVTATDGSQAVATTTMNVLNLPPQAFMMGLSPVTDEGRMITVTGFAFDQAGAYDPLDYRWSVFRQGDTVPLQTASGIDLQNFNFVALDNGPYRVSLTVSDGDGGISTVENLVEVANVAPTLEKLEIAGNLVEGSELVATAVATDPAGAEDPLGYYWSLEREGETTPILIAQGVDQHEFRFRVADNGRYVMRLIISDGDGGFVTESRLLVIENASPTIGSLEKKTVVEGGVLTLGALRFVDPGTADTHVATIDWGDGSDVTHHEVQEQPEGPLGTPEGGRGTFAGEHIYADNGQYTATVTVMDDDGGVGVQTFTVDVVNVTPELSVVGAQTIAEGSELVLSNLAWLSDPGFDNAQRLGGASVERFRYTVQWGDGTSADAGDVRIDRNGDRGVATLGSLDGRHIYADNGQYTATVTVMDDDGGVAVKTFTVAVSNVAPTITVGSLTNSSPDVGFAAEGVAVTVGLAFTDPGFDSAVAGTREDFTMSTIDWGDGSIETAPAISVVETPGDRGRLTTGLLTGRHVYNAGGIYTVSLVVRDDDGGAAQTQTTVYVMGVGVNRGVLYVIGTNGADQVEVDMEGREKPVVEVEAALAYGPGSRKSGESKWEINRTYAAGTIDRVVVVLGAGDDRAHFSGSFAKPVTMDGGAGDDELTGGAGNDVLMGGDGDDRLKGGAGNDRLEGGAGQDVLEGQAGSDVLLGGAGDDILRGGSGDAGDSDETVASGASKSSDYLEGNEGNDQLIGGNGDDVLLGGDGNDQLKGNAGNDVLSGMAGADELDGGSGRDLLFGGAGADRLDGGSDDDVLVGGISDYDGNVTVLKAVLNEWVKAVSYAERTRVLTSGLGDLQPLGARLNATTLRDDGAVDRLIGGSGRDLFFARLSGSGARDLADDLSFKGKELEDLVSL